MVARKPKQAAAGEPIPILVAAKPKYVPRYTNAPRNQQEQPSYEDVLKRKMLFAGINPEMYPNYSYLKNKNTIVSTRFIDPYPLDVKARLNNMMEFDPNVRKALRIKSFYVTNGGRNITHSLRVKTWRTVESKAKMDELLNGIIGGEIQENLFDYLDNVTDQTDIYNAVIDPYVQSQVFARAALLKKYATKEALDSEEFIDKQFFEKTPVALVPLSSMFLDRIEVNSKSWKPTRVYYRDSIFGEDKDGKRIAADWLDIKDLVMFTRNNYHILANSYQYGTSDLVPLLPLSEMLRQLYTEVLGEANSGLILPTIMLEFEGMDQKKMQQFVDNYQQGRVMGRNKAVKSEILDFHVDLKGIVEEMTEIRRLIFSTIETPFIIGGDEANTNRSVAETVTDVWLKTVLEPERDYVSDVLDDQFFRPVIHDFLAEFYPEKAKKSYKLELVTKFPKIDFSQFDLKAQGIAYYRDRGILTLRESRLMANQEPYPEDQAEIFDKIQKALMENPDIADSLLAIVESNAAAKKGQGALVNEKGDPTAQNNSPNARMDPTTQKANQLLEEQNATMVRKMTKGEF